MASHGAGVGWHVRLTLTTQHRLMSDGLTYARGRGKVQARLRELGVAQVAMGSREGRLELVLRFDPCDVPQDAGEQLAGIVPLVLEALRDLSVLPADAELASDVLGDWVGG